MGHAIKITGPISPKTARQLKGMSQAEVGVACGKPQEFISRVETGAREPGIRDARRIAEVLGIPLAMIRFPSEDKRAV